MNVVCNFLSLQEPGTPLSMQHYRGIYMLQEKVDRDKDRVNIAKFDANSDMSGRWHHQPLLQQRQHKRLAACHKSSCNLCA
jgi:hypothetical protein